MTTIEIQIEEKNKILKGLEKVYEKLIEFKKCQVDWKCLTLFISVTGAFIYYI